MTTTNQVVRYIKSGNYNFIVIAIILFWVTSNVNLDKNWSRIVEYDIASYYAYLPAIFIYEDLQFNFFEEINNQYSPDESRGDYRKKLSNGRVINKFYVGTAVLEAPFFLLAHTITKFTSNKPDGYSYWYMLFLALSSIFYTLVGLLFFSKILEKYNISRINKWFILYTSTFATNIFVYASIDPGLSHPCSFALINVLAWLFIRFNETGKIKCLILLSIVLGLIILVRPINLLVILGLFFFLDSVKGINSFLHKLKSLQWRLMWGPLLVILILSTQFFIYKLQSDQWFIYSYGSERFDFVNPEIVKFLFSYRKGYFLYTPIAFLSILAIIPMYRNSRFHAITLSSFLILLIYTLSSWWSWWYGGSFSSRVMLEFSLFVFLPLAFWINRTVGIRTRLMKALLIVLIIICQIQIYQFRYHQIHYENTTKEMYWNNFLRIDKLI